MYRSSKATLCVATAFVCTVLGANRQASAQMLLTLEGTFPSGGEFTIHPPDPCNYPTPGHFVWFLPDFTSSCGSIFTFPPPAAGLFGDAANDTQNDIQWMTDGMTIVGYQQGVPMSTLVLAPGSLLPNPLTGLGFDSVSGRMWLTDGKKAAAITAPLPGCVASPTVAIAPFNLPVGSATATDIEWDSWTNTLWLSRDDGVVQNVKVTGTPGPFGSFSPSACSLTLPHTGIAFDTATGQLYVTDGKFFEYVDNTGAPAAPTFYTPNAPCASPPPPGPPALLSGLAFSPRPLHYGNGCATVGNIPDIGFTGSFSTTPNPNFGITLTGATPHSLAVLILSTDAAQCQALTWGVCDVLVFPFLLTFLTSTDGSGDASQALPIPALPLGSPIIGLTVKAQWFVQPIPIGKQATNGLAFTIATN